MAVDPPSDTDLSECHELFVLANGKSKSDQANNNASVQLSLTPSTILSNVTKLDLSDCGLSALPDDFSTAFPNLSILFLSKNRFQQVPALIGACSTLQMVAFRSNGLESIHPNALQEPLRWLILTDNKLTTLPNTIGRCKRLQKLMLAGNQITSLPDTIANCTNLELVRLASNQLNSPPMAVLKLPNLAWIALADNPFLTKAEQKFNLNKLQILHGLDDETILQGQVLGSGAGGITRKVQWNPPKVDSMTTTTTISVAVKTFSGAITSDGLPSHERLLSCATSALNCLGLVRVLGETPTGALVMEYLENFVALAGPPNLDTCTRDVYETTENGQVVLPKISWEQAETILSVLLDALSVLHRAGICHGDFYAHNILIEPTNPSNVRLSDFGAAFLYDKTESYHSLLEQMELRAYAILVLEIQALIVDGERELLNRLTALANRCRESTASFETVLVWWKQKQLMDMAKRFEIDPQEEKYCVLVE